MDIEQTASNANFGSVTNVWQSFTPTASGYLGQVDLSFITVGNFEEGLLSFYEGQGTSGTLISSVIIDDLNGGFNSFDLPWDTDRLGFASVAFGEEHEVQGEVSAAFGYDNTVNGDYAIAVGYYL